MMKKESSNKTRLAKGAGDNSSALPNFIAILIISIVITLVLIMPIKVLLAHDFKTGEYLKSWKVKNNESFTVEYIHSVQLTPVTETYIIDNNNIILIETGFNSYGAGLPATTPYKFEIIGNEFRIYDINEIMDYLVYRTGAERANHKLLFNNKEYEFLSFSKPRTGVQFEIKDMKIFSYIIREGFN